jgi:inorganic triphosphatase YgiF
MTMVAYINSSRDVRYRNGTSHDIPPLDKLDNIMMTQEIEEEFKYSLCETYFKAAIEYCEQWAIGPTRTFEEISIYYDQPDLILWSTDTTLRVRSRYGTHEQVVKTSNGLPAAQGGITRRRQWSTPLDSERPDIIWLRGLFATPDWRANLPDVDPEALSPHCSVLLMRSMIKLSLARDAVVLAVVDKGHVTAGEFNRPIYEIEFELVTGNPAALTSIVRAFEARFGLLPHGMHKVAAAFEFLMRAKNLTASARVVS